MAELPATLSKTFVCVEYAVTIGIGIKVIGDTIPVGISQRDCLRCDTGFRVAIDNREFEGAILCGQARRFKSDFFEQVLHVHTGQVATIVAGNIERSAFGFVVDIENLTTDCNFVVQAVLIERDGYCRGRH